MAATLSVFIGLCFICWELAGRAKADAKLEGFSKAVIQSECRDRYLWIHVASAGPPPQFEAVDGSGIHSISDQLASRCGYTISTFRMDGYTTFRASYYSCYTQNQNDEVFTFNINIIITDAAGRWNSHPVSTACSPAKAWNHREIICEEEYMEVSVNRDVSCEGQQGGGRQTWQAAFSLAQKTGSSAWQLMFKQNGDQIAAMSVSEAQRLGYSLTATSTRVVFRSPYRQPQSEVVMVGGVPVEVIQASLFLKQKLMVVMIDVSMACTLNSGSFDGTRLLWDVPRVMTPLVEEGAGFESRSISLGVEGRLLDQPTAAARGFTLVLNGDLVQIGVPFGAEGGYRRSLVVNNVYRETYVIFLLYEHVFSLLYEDGSSTETRHRLLRVVDTPLRCQQPFTVDQTVSDDRVFSVYLGNIPADVALEEVKINGKQLSVAEAPERSYSISHVVHTNSSRAYTLTVPFEDGVVHRAYLGEGMVQYSLDINYTLSIMPQRDSYYHHTFIMAQVHNAFPPELRAECTDGGITFSMVKQPRLESLWEVGVGQEPLTAELAAQRGYSLRNESQSITLEVPVFSIGYTYQDINLLDFYGTFNLLLRDSKTLEVQTSTSKRCLFKTEEIIVCSADGIMTVVTTPTTTWPTVQPDRTSLLDRTCGPKQTDRSRVLFEFSLDSCGTRAMVGESYVVYENEILHDRRLITDGPAFISRDSQFKLTVRCFYPLNAVNRVFVDRIFRSETPGFGSIKVLQNTKDVAVKLPAHECPSQVSANEVSSPLSVQQNPATGGVQQYPSMPRPKPGPSRFVTVPGGNQLLPGSHDSVFKPFPTMNHPVPQHQTIGFHLAPLQAPPPSGHHMTRTGDRHVFGSSTDNSFSIFPPRYSDSLDGNVQPSHAKTQSFGFVQVGGEQSGLRDNQLFSFYASNKNPNSPGEHWGSAGHSETVQRLNSLGQTPNQVDRSPGTHGLGQGPEAKPGLSHDGSSVGRTETVHSVSQLNSGGFNTEDRTGYQLLSHDQTGSHQYDLFQMGNMPTSQLRPIQQTPLHYGPYQISSGTLSDAAVSNVRVPSRDKKYVPVAPEYSTSKNSDVQTVPDQSGDTQGSRTSQENFQGVAHSLKIQGRPSQHIEPTSNEPSPQSSRVEHNPMRTGPSEQKNDQPVQPSAQTRRPHSIRVKPPNMFAPSGEDLHQQSIIQHGGSQSYTIRQAPDSQNTNGKPATGPTGTNDKYQHPAQSVNGDTNLNPITLQHGTGRYEGLQSVRDLPIGQNSKPPVELTAVSSEGNRPTSQPAAGLSASNIREEYKPEKTSLFQQLVQPALKQERGSHSVRVKPDPSASHQSSSQYGHGSELTQQKLLQSVTERRNSGAQQSASSQQMTSHIRVRPASSQQPGSSSSPGRRQVPDQLNLQSAQNTANVPQEDPRQYGAEPGQQAPLIQPDSSQRRATLTVRVEPDPSPGNTIQQSFNQYRDLVSSESEQEPWRNILHPAAAGQDVAAPAANWSDFPPNSREPATVHYQTPPSQRKPPPNKRTPQTIRVRPGNIVLQVQNQFVNSKPEAVQPSDGGSAAEPDPGRAHGQISSLHPGSEGSVQPNAHTDRNTVLLSGGFQKPPNFNHQLSQHGRPDKHPTASRDQSHMTDSSFSTIKLDQNPVDDISSGPVENAESNPYEKFSNNGSPCSFVKVSSSLTHHVGNPQFVSHNSGYSSHSSQTNEADYPGEYHPTNPEDLNPSEDPGASPGTQTASDGSGLVLPIQRSSDCSRSGGSAPFLPGVTGHFGASVHQGIVRGQQNR